MATVRVPAIQGTTPTHQGQVVPEAARVDQGPVVAAAVVPVAVPAAVPVAQAPAVPAPAATNKNKTAGGTKGGILYPHPKKYKKKCNLFPFFTFNN